MESIYQTTQVNLWDAVHAQGPQHQPGGDAQSVRNDSTAFGVNGGAAEGGAAVPEAPPVAVPYKSDSSAFTHLALPSGLYAALDDLAATIGITWNSNPPTLPASPTAAVMHAPAAPQLEPSGRACFYNESSPTVPPEPMPIPMHGNPPSSLPATPGITSLPSDCGPASGLLQCVQMAGSVPFLHAQPLSSHAANPIASLTDHGMAISMNFGDTQRNSASHNVDPVAASLMPPGQVQQQQERLKSQQELDFNRPEVAAGDPAASPPTEARAGDVDLQPAGSISLGLQPLSQSAIAASQAPLLESQEQRTAPVAEQTQVQHTVAQHLPPVTSDPHLIQPKSGNGHVLQQLPPPAPAPLPFKAPTIAMLRAMRNSASASASAAAASAVPTTAPAPVTATITATAPGTSKEQVMAVSPAPFAVEPAVSTGVLSHTGQIFLAPQEGPKAPNGELTPEISSTGVAAVVAEPRITSTAALIGTYPFSNVCRQPGASESLPLVQAAPTEHIGGCRTGNDVLSSAPGAASTVPSNAAAPAATAGTDVPADGAGAGGLGKVSADGTAAVLPSLLSADPEELAAAIAAAVAAVAAATRATTEAAGQAANVEQQPLQPQQQAVQHLVQPPIAQQVLLPAAVVGGDLHLQQQHLVQYPPQQMLQQQHAQQLVYAAGPGAGQVQIQPQPQAPGPQQPQQLQVQFVAAPHGGGMLQVVAYGSGSGVTMPLASEGLPPAAAALLATGLSSTAAVTVAGQVHAPVQQLQYTELVQVAWPGPSGHAPATIIYNPPGGYQQHQNLGVQPQAQETYVHQPHDDHYLYGANGQQQQPQKSYISYDYDSRNLPQQSLQQPSQEHQYGTYDMPEAPRHPTPYIYRPAAAESCRDPPPTESHRAWPGGDPRPGYVPLRHRAPSMSSGDGWRSTGRHIGHRQHPQHLLWSPPPSVLYTPTRDYEEQTEDLPPEALGRGDEDQAFGTEAPTIAAAATSECELPEAGCSAGKGDVAGAIAKVRLPDADEDPSATAPPAQQRGSCSATAAAIQLIEARRKQAQAKEQLAKKEREKEQQAKEQQQTEEEQQQLQVQGKSQQVSKWPKTMEQLAKEVQAKAHHLQQQESEQPQAPPSPHMQSAEPKDDLEQDADLQQPTMAAPVSEAQQQPQPQLLRPGRTTSIRGSSQPQTGTVSMAVAAAMPDALDPKPLGRSKEQARAELNAATQAMLEKARRLRQQQLQERVQQERQRKEQEELRRQQKEQEEERLRERLRDRLSQQKAKTGGVASAAAPSAVPVLAKPQGSVAAALAARLAAAGKDGAAALAAGHPSTGGGAAAIGVVTRTGSATAEGATAEGATAGGPSGILSEDDLQELEADIALLEEQIASAPKYGLNARALVLRAADLVAKREAARPASASAASLGAASPSTLKPSAAAAPADPSAGLISVVKPLADAVPVSERVFVTYVPRSSIPRLVRQEAAHSLTGGYLALALQRARVVEERAVQAVTNEPELRKAAVVAAGQHEMAIYRQVTSKMNYELLFRKSKAEAERLQLSEELLQLLSKKYGSCVKVKPPLFGAAAAAAPKASLGLGIARSDAAPAGINGGGSVMPGTKRRLASTNDTSLHSTSAAASPFTKRVAQGTAATATAGRTAAPANGVGKQPRAFARQGSAVAAGGVAEAADAELDELFVDSGSDNERIPELRSDGSKADGAMAAVKATAAAAVKGVKAGPGPGVANPATARDSAMCLTDSGPAAAAVSELGTVAAYGTGRLGSGDSDMAFGLDCLLLNDDAPDAPYEDLLASDTDSEKQEGNNGAHKTNPKEEPAPKPALQTQPVSHGRASSPASALVSSRDVPTTDCAPSSPRAQTMKSGASANKALGAAAVTDNGGITAAAAVSGTDGNAGGMDRTLDRTKRRWAGDAGGDCVGGELDRKHTGADASGRDTEPRRDRHVGDKRRRSQSRTRGGDSARGLESRGSGGSGRPEGSLPLQGRNSGGGPQTEDSRQGGVSESQSLNRHQPQQQQQQQQQLAAAGGPVSRGDMSQEEWEQTEVRQKLRQQVLAFIHATLEPLFRAGLLGKEPYKRVAVKTSERLLSAHPNDTSADFLVREHSQVSKFIMKVVEREQQRDAEQQQEQKQKQK